MNQAPHNLDLWQWICGMPVKISAHMKFGKWHDIEVEDDVTAYCEYENGATGVFVTTTGDARGTNRFEIQLDRAKIVADYSGLSVIEYDMTEQEFSATNKIPFGSIGAHKAEIELDGQNPQHDGVLRAWGGAILRGEPLVAHGSEGIYGLTISSCFTASFRRESRPRAAKSTLSSRSPTRAELMREQNNADCQNGDNRGRRNRLGSLQLHRRREDRRNDPCRRL